MISPPPVALPWLFEASPANFDAIDGIPGAAPRSNGFVEMAGFPPRSDFEAEPAGAGAPKLRIPEGKRLVGFYACSWPFSSAWVAAVCYGWSSSLLNIFG